MKVSARSQPFNAVERQFVDALYQGASSIHNPQQIRQRMKEVAYHEAGHVAGRAFTGLEWSHVVRVSIIPNATTLGRETARRNGDAQNLSAHPPLTKRSTGRKLLLHLLAGRGAEKRFVGEDYKEDIAESGSEECSEEGTDLYRANAVAKIMRYPQMPPRRILMQAARWTKEMMELPPVWETVEKFAQLLLERGVVEDIELIDSYFSGILDMWIKLPRWKRRLKYDEKGLGLNGLPAAAS
ncbi:MAG: Peptidase family [Verrucomicrobiota bacterium]|jgi:hypothetical protein